MTAYLIVDLKVHDQKGFDEYRRDVPPLVAKHGGEYIVRGGDFEVIEGDWRPNRLVVFRFPDRAAIRNFFADPEYADLKAQRQKTSATIAVAVDGID